MLLGSGSRCSSVNAPEPKSRAAARKVGSYIDFRSFARKSMYAAARKTGFPVRSVYRNRAQRHVLDEHIRTRKGARGRSEWLCLHGVRIFSTTVQRRGERVEPQEILSAEYWAILTVLDTGAPY